MTEQEFADKYCCTDSHAEYCNDDCDSCERKFKKDLEVIKERIRADAIKDFVIWLCQSKYREIDRDSFSWYDNENIEHIESISFVINEYIEQLKEQKQC